MRTGWITFFTIVAFVLCMAGGDFAGAGIVLMLSLIAYGLDMIAWTLGRIYVRGMGK